MDGLEGYESRPIKAHSRGQNVVYNCEKEGTDAKILRIAFLNDRSREELLGEVEYIRYLFEHGGSVSDVVSSRKGNLLEEIIHNPERKSVFLKSRVVVRSCHII
ncbi:hypothetical protein [Paenibacillus alba]|uniref:hypothetical protein n=1 Tax=Paenibacillus alba TaxID=1197127 RepID=UPI001FE8D09D|nr:hypothetical protein [Paenibacillus alba]